MLSADARSRLVVVLVGARNPQNIGAAARAMRDFGFSDLRVVNAFAPPFEAAQLEARSAVGAGDIMHAAQLFSSLPEALGDCTHTVGTTALGDRGLSRPVLPLKDAAAELRVHLDPALAGEAGSAAAPGRVALLFGSEKTGLTNEQLSYCHSLLTIPMYQPEERHLSMNLGQSVAVCLYELTREGFAGSREIPSQAHPPAENHDRERLLTLVLSVMEQSGYTRRFPANARQEVVRRLTLQLGNSRDEAATWMGFYRQILRQLEQAGLSQKEKPTAEAVG